jgi:hypothetical protein
MRMTYANISVMARLVRATSTSTVPDAPGHDERGGRKVNLSADWYKLAILLNHP